jgi:hypothetical protein
MIHWLSWGGFIIGIAVLSDSCWRSIGVGVLDRMKTCGGGKLKRFHRVSMGTPISE